MVLVVEEEEAIATAVAVIADEWMMRIEEEEDAVIADEWKTIAIMIVEEAAVGVGIVVAE